MYNNEMPQASMPTGTGSVVAPKPAPVAPIEKKDNSKLILIIVIVFLSILMVTFFGLFIWKLMDYNEISTDVNGQIDVAVAAAKDKQAMELEQEFSEREKYEYRIFSGPVDYGQLSFEYPKTWSVYVASDASKGGDFKAYFNPIQVNEVSNSTIMALRVSVRDKDFESVAEEYQRHVQARDSQLSMSSITFNNITANKYVGTIPGTELSGIIVIFKIRDKTAVIQTDSVNFEADFNKLLGTVQFNA